MSVRVSVVVPSYRLRGNSRHPVHVLGMLITSLFIPFLSGYWRLHGTVKFRVCFAS